MLAALSAINIAFCTLQVLLFLVAMLVEFNMFPVVGMLGYCAVHTLINLGLVVFYAMTLLRGRDISKNYLVRYLVFFPFGHCLPMTFVLGALTFGLFSYKSCLTCHTLASVAAACYILFYVYAFYFWFKVYEMYSAAVKRGEDKGDPTSSSVFVGLQAQAKEGTFQADDDSRKPVKVIIATNVDAVPKLLDEN